MLEPGRRGALQALLFRQAFWHRDLSKFVSDRPRNLPGWWPQGDIGVILWSISAVAADWQNAATLTALCTVPEDTMPTAAHWDPAATMFVRHILDPLRWFGLVEYRGPEVSFDVRWRKTALFDRFLSFDMAPSMPDLHPVGSELGLPGLGHRRPRPTPGDALGVCRRIGAAW